MDDGMKSSLKVMVVLIVLTAVVISLYVLIFRSFGLHKKFFRPLSRLQGGVYEVTLASKSNPVPREAPGTIPYTQMAELREMLKTGQFDELNKILDGFQKAFEENPTNEHKVSDAFQSFSVTAPDYEKNFKQWIAHSPDAWQPYLALAQYRYSMGLGSRGEDLASKTSREQFAGMRQYFSEAFENIDRALAIHPRLPVAYNMMIMMHNNGGNQESENKIISTAMDLFPSSSLILFSALWSKQPRWGGSYAEMEALVKKTEPHMAENPSLAALYGLIYYDQADICRRGGDCRQAIALLNKALSFGDLGIIYKELAENYCFNLKEFDRALENVNRSIELRPTKAESYRLRSAIYLAKGQYDASKADLERAELILPGDLDTHRWREQASAILMNKGHELFKTDPRGAIQQYNIALAFNNENIDAYYWRGSASYALKDIDSALADLQAAIKIDPRHFESYRMIDYILAKDKKWDAIIEYWNTYLALEPENAGAYFERAGTYYHKHDMKRAMEDLKKACDLGNKDACKRYASWKKG